MRHLCRRGAGDGGAGSTVRGAPPPLSPGPAPTPAQAPPPGTPPWQPPPEPTQSDQLAPDLQEVAFVLPTPVISAAKMSAAPVRPQLYDVFQRDRHELFTTSAKNDSFVGM